MHAVLLFGSLSYKSDPCRTMAHISMGGSVCKVPFPSTGRHTVALRIEKRDGNMGVGVSAKHSEHRRTALSIAVRGLPEAPHECKSMVAAFIRSALRGQRCRGTTMPQKAGLVTDQQDGACST
jgi:hypothetical protein